MKKLSVLLTIFLFGYCHVVQAQTSDVVTINVDDEVYYITHTVSGYDITGLYQYEEKGEPIVELLKGGQGFFQLHGMSKTRMEWGIECDEKGVVKVLNPEGGGVYNLWYQIKETHKGPTWEQGTVDKWDVVEFWIYAAERKMHILRERIKRY